MAAPGEGNQPSDEGTPQPVVQLQPLESRVARRRLSQARHRATLAGLFNNLRKTVYSQSDLTASKVQGLGDGVTVLHTAGLLTEGSTSPAAHRQTVKAMLPQQQWAARHQEGNYGSGGHHVVTRWATVSLQQDAPGPCTSIHAHTHARAPAHAHTHTIHACTILQVYTHAHTIPHTGMLSVSAPPCTHLSLPPFFVDVDV